MQRYTQRDHVVYDSKTFSVQHQRKHFVEMPDDTIQVDAEEKGRMATPLSHTSRKFERRRNVTLNDRVLERKAIKMLKQRDELARITFIAYEVPQHGAWYAAKRLLKAYMKMVGVRMLMQLTRNLQNLIGCTTVGEATYFTGV